MSDYGNVIKKNIEKLLKERNWRIVDLENKANKGRVVHNILHRPTANPSIEVVKAISNAFNVGVEDLLVKENNENKADLKLFLDSCNNVIKHLLELSTKYEFTETSVLNLIKETYRYSKDLNLKKADPNFTAWLIKQHYK